MDLVEMNDLHAICRKAVGKRIRYVGTNGDEFDKVRYGLPVEGEGLCIECHDSHGLCIMVINSDDTSLYVDPISVYLLPEKVEVMLDEAKAMIVAKDAESGESWSNDSEAIAELMVAFAKSYTDLILIGITMNTANRRKYKQWEKRVVEICGGELE